MPKIKTNRAAAKRFGRTGGGSLRRSKAYKGHLQEHKGKKQKRNLRQTTLVSKADEKRMNRLLPNM
ncbi:MAG: 50S ribosomal protein L35 [Deltaproteobacteria bacterium]|nr:50S ribosomal protein L35 [Deltaproteobacteria bacterium]